MDRRTALKHIAAAPLIAELAGRRVDASTDCANPLQIATFQADITPPLGSPLCGGLVMPAQAVDDRLDARGVVLTGDGLPIVLCALDWVQINNREYDAWREALANAAGTTASRVAIQCVHPHNTPWVDVAADLAIQAAESTLETIDSSSVEAAKLRTAAAVRRSLANLQPFTHLGTGQAAVDKVASNRRVIGADGAVSMRMSKCTDASLRAAPAGQIDPLLKTLSFWNGEKPLAALHYYATHPMSYYGDGRISTDFCGLARNRRQLEQPEVFQIYFTGCAGDIAAGKYNDGTPAMRPILRDRIHAGMVAAWKATTRRPVSKLQWSATEISFPARTETSFSHDYVSAVLTDRRAAVKNRIKAATILSWLERSKTPVEMSWLSIGNVSILHLPGEPFVDFQLFAQSLCRERFVCVAGYGDGGMGYLPLRTAYPQGGYEPSWSFVAPESDELLRAKIRDLATA